MRRKAFLLMTVAVLSLGLAATGCEDNDGPMEDLGESIDEAVDDVGDAVEDATDNN
jgi:hypothetical protein